jgi:hypothetical protein
MEAGPDRVLQMAGPPEEMSSMYKIMLCHRIKTGLGNAEFHDHWREKRSRLVLELQQPLGYTAYAQTHQLSRLNLLYLAIRATRSRPVAALLATKSPAPGPAPDPHTRSEERWDVVDEFLFPSKEALLQALTSAAGVDAARRLIEDHAPRVRRTAVVTAEEFVASADPAPQSPEIRTVFFLRSRRDMTRAEMLGYWGTGHKRLVLSVLGDLKCRAYNQLHVRSAPDLSDVVERFGGSAGEEFDGVAELSFRSQWDLVLGLFNPWTQVANLKLARDETKFVDGQRSELVFGKHYRFSSR